MKTSKERMEESLEIITGTKKGFVSFCRTDNKDGAPDFIIPTDSITMVERIGDKVVYHLSNGDSRIFCGEDK